MDSNNSIPVSRYLTVDRLQVCEIQHDKKQLDRARESLDAPRKKKRTISRVLSGPFAALLVVVVAVVAVVIVGPQLITFSFLTLSLAFLRFVIFPFALSFSVTDRPLLLLLFCPDSFPLLTRQGSLPSSLEYPSPLQHRTAHSR
jgi:hypothetical protein